MSSISNLFQSKFKFVSSFYFQSKNAKSDKNSENGQNSIKKYINPVIDTKQILYSPVSLVAQNFY